MGEKNVANKNTHYTYWLPTNFHERNTYQMSNTQEQ